MSAGLSVRWTGYPPHYELHCLLCGEKRVFLGHYRPQENFWPQFHGWHWSKDYGWSCEACGAFVASVEASKS